MPKPLDLEQAIIVSCYTGVLICDFSKLHEAVEKRLGRPLWTHQFGDPKTVKEIEAAYKDDFLALAPPKDI